MHTLHRLPQGEEDDAAAWAFLVGLVGAVVRHAPEPPAPDHCGEQLARRRGAARRGRLAFHGRLADEGTRLKSALELLQGSQQFEIVGFRGFGGLALIIVCRWGEEEELWRFKREASKFMMCPLALGTVGRGPSLF